VPSVAAAIRHILGAIAGTKQYCCSGKQSAPHTRNASLPVYVSRVLSAAFSRVVFLIDDTAQDKPQDFFNFYALSFSAISID
jgi:hypothetical protein